jgi:hypothetical protein
VLPLQQGLPKFQAGAEVLAPGVDLCLDALVILQEQFHRGDIPVGRRTRAERQFGRSKLWATLAEGATSRLPLGI